MKCCGSFLCRSCFDYALLRYTECSFCYKSEYKLEAVFANDTSVKMEICNDCDEEIAEKDFKTHHKCTNALVSDYEDKLIQQRIELEKTRNLRMLKLELKNKLALRKMATIARKLNNENGELRKQIAIEEATNKSLKEEKNLAESATKKKDAQLRVQNLGEFGKIEIVELTLAPTRKIFNITLHSG